MCEIVLEMDGFWREPKKVWVTPCSGVYCVYACTYRAEIGKVHLGALLYVGQSENVNARIATHESLSEWSRHLDLGSGQELCYSVAEIKDRDARTMVEAALIHLYQPPCNFEFKDRYPFEDLHLVINGQRGLLMADSQISRQ